MTHLLLLRGLGSHRVDGEKGGEFGSLGVFGKLGFAQETKEVRFWCEWPIFLRKNVRFQVAKTRYLKNSSNPCLTSLQTFSLLPCHSSTPRLFALLNFSIDQNTVEENIG